MNYNKKDPTYLSSSVDMTNDTTDGYAIDDNIHCVYKAGTEEQSVIIKEAFIVLSNPDDYFYTPFLNYALLANNENKLSRKFDVLEEF